MAAVTEDVRKDEAGRAYFAQLALQWKMTWCGWDAILQEIRMGGMEGGERIKRGGDPGKDEEKKSGNPSKNDENKGSMGQIS